MIFFFSIFQFKSYNCDCEHTKAFTECYGNDNINGEIELKYTHQNAEWPYIIQPSNLLTEPFIFYNPGLHELKNGITLS